MINTTLYIDKEQFSKRLQILFNKSNRKAFELETALKVGRATVSRWRNGHTLPNDSQVREIAYFFNVRYEWLIGHDEYMTLKDMPFKKLSRISIRRENYLESIGYKIEPHTVHYEHDENGDSYIVGGTWLVTHDGISIEIGDEDLSALEKEIESFIDYKFGLLFSKNSRYHF